MAQDTDSQSKREAVDFVKQIFQSMGGRVVPPRRPRHRDKYDIMTPDYDSFMMDFENECLCQHWDCCKDWPLGNKRYEDPEWAAMIQSQVWPNHSDVDWEEYVEWVSRGFGDEWFVDEYHLQEDSEFEAGYEEARTRLRMSCACKDMVQPTLGLSTPLDNHIASLAHLKNK